MAKYVSMTFGEFPSDWEERVEEHGAPGWGNIQGITSIADLVVFNQTGIPLDTDSDDSEDIKVLVDGLANPDEDVISEVLEHEDPNGRYSEDEIVEEMMSLASATMEVYEVEWI